MGRKREGGRGECTLIREGRHRRRDDIYVDRDPNDEDDNKGGVSIRMM